MKKTFSFTGAVVIVVLAVGGYFVLKNQIVLRMDGEYKGLVAQAQISAPLEIKNFGHAHSGRPIRGYVIGSGPDTLFLFGAIHGNEMGTATLLENLIEEIRSNPNLVSPSKRLVIIPIANPDGYYDRIDKLNAHGVNLNLNFATTDWAHYGSGGTYAGDAPFSEPESQSIKSIVEEYHPYAMISFHAQGGLISPEFQDASKEWSHWYAGKTGYEYYEDWDFFGTATRWFTETTGLPSVTVELTDYVHSDWAINKKPLLELIGTDGTSLPG